MTDTKKTELFETMPIPRAVGTLAVPTIIGSLVMVLYNLADTYFVGMINDPVQTAAVSLAGPVLLSFNAVNNLFGIGGSSYMSRCLGRHDYDAVRSTSAFSFWCAFAFALLMSVGTAVFNPGLLRLLGAEADTALATRQYLFWTVVCGALPSILNNVIASLIRAEGESMHASIGTVSGCLLNVVLDPIFIMPWGLDMGASGAGCATFISNGVACLYYLVVLFLKRGSTYVSLSPRRFTLDRSIVGAVCTVGIPAAVQNLLNVTGMTVLNNFTSAYGTDAVAAMGITHRIVLVPMYFSMGLGQGIMPLVGYNYAAKNGARMKKSITFTAKLAVGFIVFAAAGFWLGAGGIIKLFMKNASIIAYGTRFLRSQCLSLPFMCIDFLGVAMFQAVGMGKESFVFALLRKVALEIPALFILDRIYPLYGLAFAQPVAELVLAFAAVFVMRKLLKEADDMT